MIDTEKSNPLPQGIHIMAKPIGPACNLNCEYCFYLEKEALFPKSESFRMSDEVLSAYITKYITSQPTPEVEFGGCPKHRFAKTYCDEPVLHYLCDGYRKFFLHIRKYLDAMTQLVANGYPASDVMKAYKGPLMIMEKK